jgi:hypothetical protein
MLALLRALLVGTLAAIVCVVALVPRSAHRGLDPGEPIAADGSMIAGQAQTIYDTNPLLGAFGEAPRPNPDDPGQFQWLIENDRWSSGHVCDALAKLIGPLDAQRCGNAARQQLIGAVRAYYNTRSREKYSFSLRGPRAEAAIEKEWSTPVDIEIDRFVRQAIRSGFLHKDEIPGNADPEFAKVVAATIEVGAFCPPVKVDRNDDTPLSAAPKKSVPDLAVAVHRHPKRNILKRT